MNPVQAPQSVEDEQSVLGAVLLSDAAMPALLVDEGLRPEHFYRQQYGAIWQAMTRLYDRSEPVDVQTVRAELERTKASREFEVDRSEVDLLAGTVPALGNVRAYAGRVRELAVLRQKLHAAYGIVAAVAAEDQDALAEAEGALAVEAVEARTFTPEQLGERLYEYLTSGGGERWSTPWTRITRALSGGLRRGTVTLVIGHSSHGKSAASDDLVDTIVGRYGKRAHVYINEMTPDERALRFAARKTGIALGRLMQPDKAKLNADEWKLILDASQHIPWGVTDAAGWTADEIARHMIRNQWDVTLVDIFQLIETGEGEVKSLDRASRVLNAAAKRANTALVLTSHVNEARSSGRADRPLPVLGDIRGTGQLKNDADTVLVVHRDQSEDGSELLPEGVIYVAKARGGTPGIRQHVHFDERRARFVSVEEGSHDYE